MSKKKQLTPSIKQFRGGYVPRQSVDEFDRMDKKEAASPEKARKRQGRALGTDGEARPGLAGLSDYSRRRRK